MKSRVRGREGYLGLRAPDVNNDWIFNDAASYLIKYTTIWVPSYLIKYTTIWAASYLIKYATIWAPSYLIKYATIWAPSCLIKYTTIWGRGRGLRQLSCQSVIKILRGSIKRTKNHMHKYFRIKIKLDGKQRKTFWIKTWYKIKS